MAGHRTGLSVYRRVDLWYTISMAKNKTLWIMQGIPGSGKSTLAKVIADKVGGTIFSTDDFWYQKNGNTTEYDFDPGKLGVAHQWNQQRTVKEMAAPDSGDIIIDNTNITRKDAEPYMVMAKIFDYDVQVVSVQVPLQVAIDRQSDRPVDRQIPDTVIHRMYEKMERLDG